MKPAKSEQKKEIEKFQKIERIVNKSFKDIGKFVNESKTGSSSIKRIGTIFLN